MMSLSDDLMNASVAIDDARGRSFGRIVTLFEGRNWTPMSLVRFSDGPEKGRAIQIPLEVLLFDPDTATAGFRTGEAG